MELKEFMKKIQQDPVRFQMLPMTQGMLYPAFSVTQGKLCAHILCHRSAVKPEGLQIWPPEYYFQYVYPQGKSLAVQSLRYSAQWESTDFDTTTLIPNRTPEERECAREAIKELNRLGDELLNAWDETGTADVRAYHQQLAQVLESGQWELYRRFLSNN